MTQTVTCTGTHRDEERQSSGKHERRKEKTDVKLKVKDGDREKCRRVKGTGRKVYEMVGDMRDTDVGKERQKRRRKKTIRR